MQKPQKKHITHHLDKKLQSRLRIYFAVSLVFLILFINDLIHGAINFEYGLLGIFAGIIIGIITARMFHISWDEDANRVVGRLDIYGIIILIAYVAFALFRNQLVSYFTHGKEVTGVTFAVLAGIMFGRVLGIRGKILQVLRKENLFG